MSRCCRNSLTVLLLGFGLLLLSPRGALGQFATPPIELSGSVSLDEADSAVRSHLERVKAYVGDGQWDEAVETLRQVMENHGTKMVPISPARYMNLSDYCQLQIASLPAPGLALYRERVDPLARQWYEEGLEKRDPARLAEVVDKMFCSSWGDDALWALGEMELERGNYGRARGYWERLVEVPPARISTPLYEALRNQPQLAEADAKLLDKWYAANTSGAARFHELRQDAPLSDADSAALVRVWRQQRLPATRFAYPGTSLAKADIRSRLVLVSILEGSLRRARDELRSFDQLNPDAEGRLAGRTVKYSEALTALITAAESWPAVKSATDWPTFAGAPCRTRIAAGKFDLGSQAFEPIQLGDPPTAGGSNGRGYSMRRIGEDSHGLLSYHPIVAGDLLLVNQANKIFAFNLKTGKPAWPSDDPKRTPGEIFDGEANAGSSARMGGGLGVPRFTMTVHNDRLYARMGSQVTSRPMESFDGRGGGYLVCLDLAAQGRVVWTVPDANRRSAEYDERWAFEGSPLVDGANVYIGMRKSDVRPQAYVACLDAETGRRRWRTMICGAETPSGGQNDEITHNLLTLEQGTLYYNTNLGAVAALSARDGRLEWVAIYPRSKKASPDGQDKRTAHFYRDLNPCIYYRGLLLAAPSDCESIFALEASTGELVWENHLPEDTVHLLGVGKGNLLASGDTLWWIDAEQGKVLKRWPTTYPLGYGRGVLLGDLVLWPTRKELFVFDQAVTKGQTAERDPIALAQDRGASGGNLLAIGDRLLIAAPDKIFAFEQAGADVSRKTVASQDAPAEPAANPRPAAGGTIKETTPPK